MKEIKAYLDDSYHNEQINDRKLDKNESQAKQSASVNLSSVANNDQKSGINS